MSAHYPPNTVRTLLATDQVTSVTRQALLDRLDPVAYEPAFFSASDYALLQAICDRLIPQDDGTQRIDIAAGIDKRLTENKSNGWRYDVMPADREAYRQGLAGIEQSAVAMFGDSFQQLSHSQQDSLLTLIQTDDPPGIIWQTLPAGRFFEEMLAEAAENYYSHPLAQETIGYVGMADVPGWQRIGLNQLEDREPRAL